LDLKRIVGELKKQRDRIKRAIAALMESYSALPTKKTKAAATSRAALGKKRGLTPAGRRQLSLKMKKRWAESRKKGLKKLG